MPTIKSQFFKSAAAGLALFTSGCIMVDNRTDTVSVPPESQDATTKVITVDLPANGLISLIAPNHKGTKAASDAYRNFRANALPLAREYGYKPFGSLVLAGTAVGSYQPQGFLITAWPSQRALEEFQNDPRWAPYAAIRPTIWDDIRYYRDVQEEGLSLSFRSDKFYTLAIVDINPDEPTHYDQYLANLEGVVAQNGGRFILKINDPSLESLSNTPAPDRMVFIEWDDAEGVDRLLRSAAYKATSHLAASGTTSLSFFRLKVAP